MRLRLLAPAALLLLATACSGEPEPRFADPTPTPEPPTSESTAPDDPTTSAAPERESPEDFIRRFQTEAIAMQETGDTTAFRSMFAACESCEVVATNVEDVYAEGGFITSTPIKVKAITRVGDSDGVAIYEYVLVSGRTVVTDGAGGTDEFPGGEERFQINLKRSAGQWVVSRLSQIAA